MATTVASSVHELVAKCTAMTSDLLRLPAQHVWVDYDADADVLYMSFRKPQRATRTIELDDDTLVRKDGQTVVGVTILNASTRAPGNIAGQALLRTNARRRGRVASARRRQTTAP